MQEVEFYNFVKIPVQNEGMGPFLHRSVKDNLSSYALRFSSVRRPTVTDHLNKPSELSTSQRHGFDVSQGDRIRSLDAMHVLESMIGRAAPGRDLDWQADIVDALRQLEPALRQQQASYEDPTSLLAEIALEHPRLRTWVRQLHRQWSELAANARSLREQLEQSEEPAWDYADVRERLHALLKALHHHRAREADLVFEALSVDLGIND